LDVYRRAGIHRLHTLRVRRYGSMPWAFLERKSRVEGRVRKRRTPVAADDVQMLALARSLPDWAGRWFQRALHAKGLLPASRVEYQRTAFAGHCDGNPLRLTLDRNICGALPEDWALAPNGDGRALLEGNVILELKFRSALPAQFQELVHDLKLSPSTLSKYRLCRSAWGAPAAVGLAEMA
jgi:VTC domain